MKMKNGNVLLLMQYMPDLLFGRKYVVKGVGFVVRIDYFVISGMETLVYGNNMDIYTLN